MEPWQSWAAALALSGGLAYYYTKDTNAAAKIGRAVQSTVSPQAPTTRKRQEKQTSKKSNVSKVADKAKEAVDSATEATTSAVSDAVNQPKKTKKGKENSAAKPVAPPTKAVEEDEGNGDLEWAAQLDAKRKGVSLTAPSALNKPAKTKQSKQTASNGSANGGSSSYVSKDTSEATSAPVGGDVSDMLEASAPAASVLRIVGEEKPKKQQAPKVEPVQESKKQRQNRRKVEEQRVVREQQEEERLALLEKQRRTAREARGEPAKNGMAPSKAPSSSAWSGSSQPTTNGAGHSSESNGVALLDTFDQDNASTASFNEATTNTNTPVTAASAAEQDFLSEEAQIERLSDMDGWAEVAKPKKGKKKTESDEPTAAEIKNDVSASIAKPSVSSAPKPTPALKSKKQQQATNGFAALEEQTPIKARSKGHPDDSDWL